MNTKTHNASGVNRREMLGSGVAMAAGLGLPGDAVGEQNDPAANVGG